MTPGIAVSALFLLGMGLSALLRPAFVVSFVGLVPSTPDARNEVRAVYGGFGIALAVLLVFTAENSALRPGVLLAAATALLGMAAGRALSLLIERTGRWPLVFFSLEAVLGAALLRDAGLMIF